MHAREQLAATQRARTSGGGGGARLSAARGSIIGADNYAGIIGAPIDKSIIGGRAGAAPPGAGGGAS